MKQLIDAQRSESTVSFLRGELLERRDVSAVCEQLHPAARESALRRLRQIDRREAKFFAQFSVKIFESGSQFGFDSFTRLRFLQLGKT